MDENFVAKKASNLTDPFNFDACVAYFSEKKNEFDEPKHLSLTYQSSLALHGALFARRLIEGSVCEQEIEAIYEQAQTDAFAFDLLYFSAVYTAGARSNSVQLGLDSGPLSIWFLKFQNEEIQRPKRNPSIKIMARDNILGMAIYQLEMAGFSHGQKLPGAEVNTPDTVCDAAGIAWNVSADVARNAFRKIRKAVREVQEKK